MYTIQRAYQDITKKVKGKIDSEKDDILIGSPIEELVDYYFSLDSFHPIEVDAQIGETAIIEKGFHIPDNMLNRKDMFESPQHDFTTERLLIHIPITPKNSLAGLREIFPIIGNSKEIRLKETGISLQVDIKQINLFKDNATVSEETDAKRKIAYEWIHTVSQQIQNLNRHLREDIQRFIENRREHIQSTAQRHQQLSQLINIPYIKKMMRLSIISS